MKAMSQRIKMLSCIEICFATEKKSNMFSENPRKNVIASQNVSHPGDHLELRNVQIIEILAENILKCYGYKKERIHSHISLP